MKREIKFRGKSIKSGDWEYGSYLNLPDSQSHHIVVYGTYKPHIDHFEAGQVEVDPSTVGQFIGGKDKNGVEIYEGDIVRFYDDTDDEMCNGEVMYSADYSGFFIAVPHRDAIILNIYWEWEVVGNIHDNPELLKGGKR